MNYLTIILTVIIACATSFAGDVLSPTRAKYQKLLALGDDTLEKLTYGSEDTLEMEPVVEEVALQEEMALELTEVAVVGFSSKRTEKYSKLLDMGTEALSSLERGGIAFNSQDTQVEVALAPEKVETSLNDKIIEDLNQGHVATLEIELEEVAIVAPKNPMNKYTALLTMGDEALTTLAQVSTTETVIAINHAPSKYINSSREVLALGNDTMEVVEHQERLAYIEVKESVSKIPATANTLVSSPRNRLNKYRRMLALGDEAIESLKAQGTDFRANKMEETTTAMIRE